MWYLLKTKALSTLVLCGLLCVGCTSSAKPEQQGNLLFSSSESHFQTAPVSRGVYTETVSSTASLYEQTVQLTTGSSAATFLSFAVKAGDPVQQGDLIATVQPDIDPLDLEEKQRELSRKESALAQGKTTRQQEIQAAEALVDSLTPGTTEYRLQQLRVKRLQLSYQTFVHTLEYETGLLRRQISILQQQQNSGQIVAPCDGTVKQLGGFQPGDPLQPDTAVVQIAPHRETGILLSLEDPNHLFRYNLPVTVEMGNETNRREFQGRIVYASNVLHPSMETDTVYLLVDASPESDTANALVSCHTVEISDVLIADAKGISEQNGSYFTTVLTEDGTIQKRYVTTAHQSDTARWIVTGLSEGQSIILD